MISPHLDDGVLGCGALLAAHPGSVVVTALAGRPAAYAEVTPWDAAAGFGPGEDVVGARRAEDAAALAELGARPVWLDFPDSQYGDSPDEAALADGLEAAICESGLTTLYFPLGLFHSDHILTHCASLRLMRRRPEWTWLAYEDALYRRIDDLLQERLCALRAAGVAAAPEGESTDRGRGRKRRAVAAYASQLRALATPGRLGHADAFAPERYWRLSVRQPE